MDTVLLRFYQNVKRYAHSTCFKTKRDGKWRSISWEEAFLYVRGISRDLIERGIKKGDYVGIIAPPSPEWALTDLAILSVGAITVPIHTTSGPSDVLYILRHSAPKCLFFSHEFAWILDGTAKDVQLGSACEIRSAALPGLGMDNISEQEWLRLVEGITLDDVATCIYTSGTTGEPKGALITHLSISSEVDGLREAFGVGHGDVGYAFLPLSHVMGRIIHFYHMSYGCEMAYASSPKVILEEMREIMPHFTVVVPRVLEKVYDGWKEKIKVSNRLSRWIIEKAERVGARVLERERFGVERPHPLDTPLRYLTTFLAFFRLRKLFGGRLKFIICGGAPLAKEIVRFFHIAGLPVFEGYGLTETMSAVTINRPGAIKFGSVGKPICGAEIKLAEDGEVMVRGPQLFIGYKPPCALRDGLEDGWFRTGDIGELSRDGFLMIVGRKKELVVTSTGRNISPLKVEEVLRSSEYIKDAIVVGDGKPYLSALILLDMGRVTDFAIKNGIRFEKTSDLINDGRIYELIKSEIDAKNRYVARHEAVRRFKIIDRDFWKEDGYLTPTMKLRRWKVYETYKGLIESLYE